MLLLTCSSIFCVYLLGMFFIIRVVRLSSPLTMRSTSSANSRSCCALRSASTAGSAARRLSLPPPREDPPRPSPLPLAGPPPRPLPAPSRPPSTPIRPDSELLLAPRARPAPPPAAAAAAATLAAAAAALWSCSAPSPDRLPHELLPCRPRPASAAGPRRPAAANCCGCSPAASSC